MVRSLKSLGEKSYEIKGGGQHKDVKVYKFLVM